MIASIEGIKKLFRKKFTSQAVGFFLVSNLIFAVLVFLKVPLPFSFSNSSVTNFFFALAAITAMGFSLSFSAYEIDELKEYKEGISSRNIPNTLKDTIGAAINLKIRDAKPVNISAAKFYLFMTICSSAAIIMNELFCASQAGICSKILFMLKGEGLICLFIVILHLISIYRYKESLVELTSEYDKIINQIAEVQSGNYTSLLPP